MSLRTELDDILKQMQVVETKTEDDPITDQDWNALATNFDALKRAIAAIRDLPACTLPKGFLYVRFPGKPLPYDVDGMFPWTTKSDWQNLTTKYPGTFLRLAGGDASTFQAETETVTYDNGVKGTGGGQMDALQKHEHTFIESSRSNWGYAWGVLDSVGISKSNKSTTNVTGRTTTETRPKNITVEVYMYLVNG